MITKIIRNANTNFSRANQKPTLNDKSFYTEKEADGQSVYKNMLALTDKKYIFKNHSIDETIDDDSQFNTHVFTIGLGANIDENVLKNIANIIGNKYYVMLTSTDFEEISRKISKYIQSQYQIIYTTHNRIQDGTWRKVYIEVSYQDSMGYDTTRYHAPNEDSVHLCIAIYHGLPGRNISIPVNISETTGKEIYSFGFTILYDSNVLSAIGANTSGTIAESWGNPMFTIRPGKISIYMVGTSPLSGLGPLLNITFNIVGGHGQSTDLHFEDAMFNEGYPYASTTDGLFTVVSGAIIEVISPNGDEVWKSPNTYEIVWSSNFTSNNVNIQYSTDGCTTWHSITANTPDDGSYLWNIPRGINSAQCKIKITDVIDTSCYDESDGYFTIIPSSFICITSPNGGERWLVGSTHNVAWISNGTSGNIRVDLSLNGGMNWITITANTADDGIYAWTIPHTPSFYYVYLR